MPDSQGHGFQVIGVDATYKVTGSLSVTEFNLRCPSGHRWYSPMWKAFIGSDCGYSVGESKCREKLERL